MWIRNRRLDFMVCTFPSVSSFDSNSPEISFFNLDSVSLLEKVAPGNKFCPVNKKKHFLAQAFEIFWLKKLLVLSATIINTNTVAWEGCSMKAYWNAWLGIWFALLLLLLPLLLLQLLLSCWWCCCCCWVVGAVVAAVELLVPLLLLLSCLVLLVSQSRFNFVAISFCLKSFLFVPRFDSPFHVCSL